MSYIVDKKEESGMMNFTIQGVDTIFANCLRRTILAHIDTLGIRAIPYDDNDINMIKNTSQFNNEILFHRISCIPVHISDLTKDYKQLKIVCNVENDTDQIIDVTSKDFKIKDTTTDKFLEEEIRDTIFPADPKTKDYVLFARLLPSSHQSIRKECIHFEATLSLVNAKLNSVFNVVSTCSYQFTPDRVKQKNIWTDIQKELIKKEMNSDEIADYKKNWEFQDSKRIFKKNSFDFSIETIGVFNNRDIVKKACYYIIQQMDRLKNDIEDKQLIIKKGNTNITSYDITITDDNHTISKLVEYALYTLFYEEKQVLSFVGYRKEHPHRNFGIIRVAFNDDTMDEDYIYNLMDPAVQYIRKVYSKIANDI